MKKGLSGGQAFRAQLNRMLDYPLELIPQMELNRPSANDNAWKP